MIRADNQQQFVLELTANQNRVYGYIYSMLADHVLAADVLQETNLVLWKRCSEWSPGSPFLPWAFAVARFQVLAALRDRKRERCLLDTELVEALSADIEAQVTNLDETRLALRNCLLQLSEQNRELIESRYYSGKTISALAEMFQRSIEAIKVSLLRIRRSLHDCVARQLATQREAQR